MAVTESTRSVDPTTPSRTRSRWGDRSVKATALAAVAVASLVAVLVGVMGISALGDTADPYGGRRAVPDGRRPAHLGQPFQLLRRSRGGNGGFTSISPPVRR
jgi:hypothetical protein